MMLKRAPSRAARSSRAEAVTIRWATPGDAGSLSRLSLLDSSSVPVGPTLVAEVAGEIVAALPVAGAPAIADPFRPTAAIVALLELRAGQLRAVVEREAPDRLEASARRAGAALAWERR
jgi:hypothetical protein